MYGGLMILCQAFGPPFLRINHFLFALIWSFSFLRLIFIRVFFFYIVFPIILWSISDLDRLSSCASSDSLISLSYSMAVFSTNSFGPFFQIFQKILVLIFTLFCLLFGTVCI